MKNFQVAAFDGQGLGEVIRIRFHPDPASWVAQFVFAESITHAATTEVLQRVARMVRTRTWGTEPCRPEPRTR
jgi:hypothetical protein